MKPETFAQAAEKLKQADRHLYIHGEDVFGIVRDMLADVRKVLKRAEREAKKKKSSLDRSLDKTV